MKSRMILTVVVGSQRERYERQSRRRHIQPSRDCEHREDFDYLRDVDRNLGGINLKILALKEKTDLEAYLD